MTTTAAAPPAGRLSQNGGFLLFIAGQFVSRAGDGLVALAAVWLVLELSDNNPLASSAALAFQFVPFLLFGFLGGVVADRWDRRFTMSAIDAMRGLVLLPIPLLDAAGQLRVWHVVLVIFLLSSLGRLFVPARRAILPDLVSPAQLVRANAVAEGTGQAASVGAPLLAGVLVAITGAAAVFYLDAATFFFSALTLLLIRLPHTHARRKAENIWREALGGIRHVIRSPVLRGIVLVSPSATISFVPVPALLPVLVRGDIGGGSRLLGLLTACFFVGSVLGSAVIGRAGARLHRGWAVLAGILLEGAAVGGLALAPWPIAVGALLLLLGVASAGFNIAEFSLIQTETPDELRGRVFAVMNVIAQGLSPGALLVAGIIAGLASVRLAFGVMACVAVITGLLAVRSSALRSTR